MQAIDILSAQNQVVGSLKSVTQPVQVTFAEAPTAIRVTFTDAVDLASVTAGDPTTTDPASYSFLVQGGDFAKNMPPGSIQSAGPNTAIFRVTGGRNAFLPATYKVTLFGEALPTSKRPAISSTSHAALDGEPKQLPSGDGNPGGDFTFTLLVKS